VAGARSVRARKIQAGLLVGAVVGALAAAGAYLRPGAVERAEFWTYDIRARGAVHVGAAASDIVLVHVSEEDIRSVERNIKVPFPWPRALYGYITRHIASGKPKAIIYDWLFQGRGVVGADDADQFASAMKENGRTVIGLYVSDAERLPQRPAVAALVKTFPRRADAFAAGLRLLAYDGRAFLDGNGPTRLYLGGDSPAELAELWGALAGAEDLAALFPRQGDAPAPPPKGEAVPAKLLDEELTEERVALEVGTIDAAPPLGLAPNDAVDPPLPALAVGAGRLGNVVQRPEADGVVRLYYPVVSHRSGKVFPSLALAGWMVAHPDTPPRVDGSTLVLGDERVALDDEGRFALRYHGPSDVYQAYSAYKILRSFQQIQDGEPPEVPPFVFKDKYVIVAATGQALKDIRPTPVSKAHLGAAINATALDNLLAGDSIRRGAAAVDAALAFGLCVVLAVGMAAIWSFITNTGLAFLVTLAATALVLGGYSLGADRLYARTGVWIAVAVPVIGAALATFGAVVTANALERNDKRFIEKALNRYTSKALAEELMKHPEYLALGGARREISVYFSDIAGFTTISEGLTAESLVGLLNEYLTAMTDVVDRYDGYLDKYIGDAVMAFWGGLVPDEKHAERAVLAAIDMRDECLRRNPEWKAKYGFDITARAGLNSGYGVVGNMGSHNKYNYTAMGDMVNVASRLEGANKSYGTLLMVSEFTWDKIHHVVDGRELDFVAVKGKEKPVGVYEILARKGDTAAVKLAAAARFGEGLALYRARRFAEARPIFEEVAAEHDDGPAKTYVKRCQLFEEEPPAADWDGVWHMKEK
jgi:adenylate cyclase